MRVPVTAWAAARLISLGLVMALVALLLADPHNGLLVFWGLVVPLVPLLWMFAPGFWRNVCPMAASNQLPRVLDISRARPLPAWLERHGFAIGMVLFFGLVTMRPFLLEHNGAALAFMLGGVIAVPFAAGLAFKGKSGFCGSICPLRPSQALLSRAPVLKVDNSHCRPCVGCTTNCPDLMPGASFVADLRDRDARRAGHRWLFAGLLPGFTYAFFTLPPAAEIGLLGVLARLGPAMLLGIGALAALKSLTGLDDRKLTALFAAVSVAVFYWFNVRFFLNALDQLLDVSAPSRLVWEGRVVMGAIIVSWLARVMRDGQAARAAKPSEDKAPAGDQLAVVFKEAAPRAKPVPTITSVDRPATAVAASPPVLTGDPPVEIPDRRSRTRQMRANTVTIWPEGRQIDVEPGTTLSQAARAGGLPLPEGCGTGLCGCDPVYVLAGSEHLSEINIQERATLARLGLADHVRMACTARVTGDVTMSAVEAEPLPQAPPAPITEPSHAPELEPEAEPARIQADAGPVHAVVPGQARQASEPLAPPAAEVVQLPAPRRAEQPAAQAHEAPRPRLTVATAGSGVQRVVVLGNGVAGVTAASHVRRLEPDCEIDLITDSPHPFYNRIAIARLIHERTGIGRLELMPNKWYADQRITQWLNTRAIRIDRAAKRIVLGTGETLPYDRLILATGARSSLPPVAGMNLPGIFGIREAEDAMRIRAYAQSQRCERAVVVGGGLLGLEAADALAKLGLRCSIIEGGPWLSNRELDARGGEILLEHLTRRGIDIHVNTPVESVVGTDRAEGVRLRDGRVLKADLIVACTGIVTNAELAREAGLEVARGIVVDEHMRTADPAIMACGDVAEFEGRLAGHWAVAVTQAEVAAITALGGTRRFGHTPMPVALKLPGMQVTTIGRTTAAPSDEQIVVDDGLSGRYRKVLLSEGKPVGIVAIGAIDELHEVIAAVQEQRASTTLLQALTSRTVAPSRQDEAGAPTARPVVTDDVQEDRPLRAAGND